MAVMLGRSIVQGDFGDHVDPIWNSPATTTCKQVCVANVTDCPSEMLCSDGQALCADGACSLFCTGNEVSPCEFACAPIACQKVIDSHDQCAEKYGGLVALEAACGEIEIAEEISLWTFKEAGFVFFYVWICVATFLVLAWCAYNQGMTPVEGSTQSLGVSFLCHS